MIEPLIPGISGSKSQNDAVGTASEAGHGEGDCTLAEIVKRSTLVKPAQYRDRPAEEPDQNSAGDE